MSQYLPVDRSGACTLKRDQSPTTTPGSNFYTVSTPLKLELVVELVFQFSGFLALSPDILCFPFGAGGLPLQPLHLQRGTQQQQQSASAVPALLSWRLGDTSRYTPEYIVPPIKGCPQTRNVCHRAINCFTGVHFSILVRMPLLV